MFKSCFNYTDLSLPTVVGWIIGFWTMEIECTQKWYQIVCTTRVNALTIGYGIQVIEHGESQCAGLMDGADDIPSLHGQLLEQ